MQIQRHSNQLNGISMWITIIIIIRSLFYKLFIVPSPVLLYLVSAYLYFFLNPDTTYIFYVVHSTSGPNDILFSLSATIAKLIRHTVDMVATTSPLTADSDCLKKEIKKKIISKITLFCCCCCLCLHERCTM